MAVLQKIYYSLYISLIIIKNADNVYFLSDMFVRHVRYMVPISTKAQSTNVLLKTAESNY